MNLIEFDIENIKKYELDIWQASVCSGLADIRIINDRAVFDSSGLYSLGILLRTDKHAAVTENFCRILSCFRKIIEAEIRADAYLIDNHSISLDPDRLWFDEKCAKLLPGHSDEDFFDRLCSLADRLGANNLSQRLKQENDKARMSEKDLLRFLSIWELEIK